MQTLRRCLYEVTDSEQLLGFFNRPVVLSLLGEACARHQIAPPLPLCSLRDLDPVPAVEGEVFRRTGLSVARRHVLEWISNLNQILSDLIA